MAHNISCCIPMGLKKEDLVTLWCFTDSLFWKVFSTHPSITTRTYKTATRWTGEGVQEDSRIQLKSFWGDKTAFLKQSLPRNVHFHCQALLCRGSKRNEIYNTCCITISEECNALYSFSQSILLPLFLYLLTWLAIWFRFSPGQHHWVLRHTKDNHDLY